MGEADRRQHGVRLRRHGVVVVAAVVVHRSSFIAFVAIRNRAVFSREAVGREGSADANVAGGSRRRPEKTYNSSIKMLYKDSGKMWFSKKSI